MAISLSKISRKAYELPLLKTLSEVGGSSAPNDDLYSRVASKLGFAGKTMEFDAVHAKPKWIYDIQWVRYDLVKRGEIDGSRRGIWKITDKGRQRVSDEWPSFRVENYLVENIDTAASSSAASSSELPTDSLEKSSSDDWSVKFSPASIDAIKRQLLIDDTPVFQIVTIINAGKHLILTGPPGTGKTTLAVNAAEQAVQTKFVAGYLLRECIKRFTVVVC